MIRSSATKDTENEEIDEDEEDDSSDVASFEEESISNPLESSSSTQRVTPNYVNIRRTRPSTTTSKYDDNMIGKIIFTPDHLSCYLKIFRTENDVEEKEEEVEEERPTTRRRRPYVSK